MRYRASVIFLIITFFSFQIYGSEDVENQTSFPRFVFFTGSYNNELWVERYMESLASQTYTNWECIYINDASGDATGEYVEYFAEQFDIRDKVQIVHNSHRKGLVENMYNAIHMVDPTSIIVVVDGDDFLAHPYVLQRLYEIYQDPSVWTTYGDYTPSPPIKNFVSLCADIPASILKKNRIRNYPWVTSHLRTFYAKLFHMIRKEDLQTDGCFFDIAGDVATMFPILEMSSKGHIKRVKEVLLCYNVENVLSDRYQLKRVKKASRIITSQKRYRPIQGLLFP